TRQPGERRGGDDRPTAHRLRELQDAEHDPVDVDGHRAAIVLVRQLPRQHTRVEAREVDGADTLPRSGIRDVESAHEIQRLDVVSLPLEARTHGPAEPTLAARDERLHGSRITLPTCRRVSINA